MAKNKYSDNLRNRAASNSFYTILTSIINKIGAVIFTIIVARILQPTLFGVYGLATATVAIFLSFADLGINASLIRYSAYAFEKSKRKVASYFQYLLKIKSLLIIILSILLIILAKPISELVFHKAILFWPLILCSLYLITSSFLDFICSIFYSLGKVRYVAIREIIAQVGRILIFLLLAFFLLKSFLVIDALLAISLAFLFAAIFLVFVLFKKYHFLFERTGKLNSAEKRVLFSFIFILAIGGIFGIFNSSVDTLLLGIFLQDTANIGLYRSALLITSSAVGIIALGNVFLPIFTQLKGIQLSKSFEKLFNYCIILSFPIAFGIAMISTAIMTLIYGITYSSAAILLSITAFTIIPSTLSSIFGLLFFAKGKPLKPTIIVIIATGINTLLNLFLITLLLKQSEFLATIGAAIAITINSYLSLVFMAMLTKKEFNIKIKKTTFVKVLFSCLIMVFILFLFSIFFKQISPLNLILEMILGLATYIGIMLLLKNIKKEDFELIKRMIKK